MSPRFFIDRPIFASVLSIVIVVVGLVSMRVLPVAQYPEITPPVVQIEADYPGASAEVVADAVARPIEVQLPGIDNLLYYDSTSTNDGHMTLRLTFEIGTDVDIAAVQTQNREKLAEPQLPPEVVRRGITVRKVSPDLLAVLTLESTDPRHDALFLANYAILRVLDNIKRLPGVGDALVFGAQSYSHALDPRPGSDGAARTHPDRHRQCRQRAESRFSRRSGGSRARAPRNRADPPGDHPRPHDRGE